MFKKFWQWLTAFLASPKPPEQEPPHPEPPVIVTPVPSPTPPVASADPIGSHAAVYFGKLSVFGGAKSLEQAIENMKRYKLILLPSACILDKDWQLDDAKSVLAAIGGTVKFAVYLGLGKRTTADDIDNDGEFNLYDSEDYLKWRMDRAVSMGFKAGFLDMFGEDYNIDRKRQNFGLNLCHSAGLPAVMNAWEVSHIYNPERAPLETKAGDMMMFEDLGADLSHDQKKWNEWNSKNVKGLGVWGVGLGKNKNIATDVLFGKLSYGGYAGKLDYAPKDGVLL